MPVKKLLYKKDGYKETTKSYLNNATVEETEDHVGDTAKETEQSQACDRPQNNAEVDLTCLADGTKDSRSGDRNSTIVYGAFQRCLHHRGGQ